MGRGVGKGNGKVMETISRYLVGLDRASWAVATGGGGGRRECLWSQGRLMVVGVDSLSCWQRVDVSRCGAVFVYVERASFQVF